MYDKRMYKLNKEAVLRDIVMKKMTKSILKNEWRFKENAANVCDDVKTFVSRSIWDKS